MPNSEPKRARRRRDLIRMRAKARRLYPFARCPQRNADNLAVCSCWMCGNPRRYFGEPTLQEKRAIVVDTCVSVP